MSAAARPSDICLPDVVLDIRRAPDTETLVALFHTYINTYNLGPFVLAEIRYAGKNWRDNLILGTISEAYQKEYFQTKSLFDSPTFRTAQYACKPTSLAEIFDRNKLSRRGMKIYERARKNGLGQGYCFPLKGRSCRPTLMYIAGDFTTVDDDALMMMELVILAFYRRACALVDACKPQDMPNGSDLSDRERETLSWVAQGKTDWEIAQLLGISERTVHYHIENAKKKMGVPTRLQAVVQAVRKLEILV